MSNNQKRCDLKSCNRIAATALGTYCRQHRKIYNDNVNLKYKNRDKTTCLKVDCNEPAKIHVFCQKHGEEHRRKNREYYHRAKNNRDTSKCKVANCENKLKTKIYCKKHLEHINALIAKRPNKIKRVIICCSAAGCNRKLKTKNHCEKHRVIFNRKQRANK